MDDRWALVGRVHELEALLAAYRRATDGGGLLAAVTGEAGMGKTHLLEAFAQACADSGARVAWGRGWEAGGTPPLVHWTEVLRDLDVAWPMLPAADDFSDYRLAEAVASAVAGAASSQPLVVLLDDLHAADAATIDVLASTARRLAGQRVLIAAAWRDTASNDPEVLAALNLLRPRLNLPLEPLSRDDVAQLVGAVHGAPVAPDAVHQVWDVSGGNPLLAHHAFAALRRGERGVSASVRALTRSLLATSPHDSTELVKMAAVVGRDVDARVLAAAAGQPLDRVLLSLHAPDLAGLLLSVGPHLWRFRHELLRAAVEDDLDPVDAAHRHAAVLRALTARGDAVPASALARHHVAAVLLLGEERAAEACVQAADEAAQALAPAAAAAHLTTAMQLLVAANDPHGSAMVRLRRGECRLRAGDHVGAGEDFGVAFRQAQALHDPLLLGRAALGVCGARGYGPVIGQSGVADSEHVEVLAQALAAQPPGDTPVSVELTARLATELWYEHDAADRVRELLAASCAMADRLGDAPLQARARLATFFAATFERSPDELDALVAEVRDLHRRCDDLALRSAAEHAMFVHSALRGDLAAARDVARSLHTRADRLRVPSDAWRVAIMTATLELVRGRLDRAQLLVDEAADIGHAAGLGSNVDVVHATQTTMLHRRRLSGDDLDVAREMCLAGMAYAPGITTLAAGAALSSALAGDLDAGRALAVQALAQAERRVRDVHWLGTVTVAVEALALAGLDAQDAEPRRLLDQALDDLRSWEGWTVTIGTGLDLIGSVDRALAVGQAFYGRWTAAEAGFDAALASSASLGDWVAQQHTRLLRARLLHRREGWTPQVTALVAQIRDVGARHGIPDWGEAALRELRAPSRPAARTASPSATTASLREQEDGWCVVFDGRVALIPHRRGFDVLATLVRQPGVDVSVIDLAGARVDQRDTGAAIDAAAQRKYRARAAQLQEELEDLPTAGDDVQRTAIRRELEQILDELSAATDRMGRPRRTGSSAERLRVTVTKAVRAAIGRVGEHHPELGRHLERSVTTGRYCRYEPDPTSPIRWTVHPA